MILLVLLLSVAHSIGQSNDRPTYIRLGYFSPFLTQPGIKASVDFPIKQWKEPYTLLLSPQAAIFGRSLDYTALLLNGEIGIKRQKEGRKSYSMLSLGAGYLAHQEVLSQTVDLSGETVAAEKEWRNYSLPTISYTFGRRLSESLGYYAKLSYGPRRSKKHPNADILFVELGLSYSFSDN